MSVEKNSNKFLIGLICFLIIAFIIGLTIWCYYYIKEHHLQNDPMLIEIKNTLLPLHPEIKNIKMYKSNKSYTLNKKDIYICTTDENDDYYDKNMLIHVTIHEIAHYLNKEDIGHTPKFHEIFEELLEKASQMGIYDPSKPLVVNYCPQSK